MAQHRVGIHAALDQLDGNTLFVLLISTFRQINCAYTAAPDLANNAVCAY